MTRQNRRVGLQIPAARSAIPTSKLRAPFDSFDLVGTTAVPAHAFDIAELTDLTPALETAAVDHGTSVEASEAVDVRGTHKSASRFSAFGISTNCRSSEINHY
jgi:hypothetical protein